MAEKAVPGITSTPLEDNPRLMNYSCTYCGIFFGRNKFNATRHVQTHNTVQQPQIQSIQSIIETPNIEAATLTHNYASATEVKVDEAEDTFLSFNPSK